MSAISICPTCNGTEPCREGVRVGGIIGLFMTTRMWRKSLSDAEFCAHQPRVFAYGQAVHANDIKAEPSPGVYITVDPILLKHAATLGHRFGVLPISFVEAERRGITQAHPACELGAGTDVVPVAST